MYKALDRKACNPIRDELNSLLEQFTTKHTNLSAEVDGMSYGGDHMVVKVQIALKDEDGNVQSREASAFIDYAAMGAIRDRHFRKLTPDHLWQTFTVGGDTYKIMGYKSRARKRPIIALRQDGSGKEFVFPTDTVVNAILGRYTPEAA